MPSALFKTKWIEFLNPVNIYITSNLITGCFSVISIYLIRIKHSNWSLFYVLFSWYGIRFLSDIFATTIDLVFHKNPIPIFHISTLLETLLMVIMFQLISRKLDKIKLILFSLPFAALFLDIVFLGTFFDISTIGHVISFALTSLLLLFILLIENRTIDKQTLMVIRIFFFYHTIVFFYSLFQEIIRSNIDYFDFCYPIFFIINLLMNCFPIFLLWSMRRS